MYMSKNHRQNVITQAANWIAGWEGLELHVYTDIGGHRTVGYGHRTALKPGTNISIERAQKWLRNDTIKALNCVTSTIEIQLTTAQLIALTDFVFECGCAAFKGSRLAQFINMGDLKAATAEFTKWNHVNGKPIGTLTLRRDSEAKLFSSPSVF